MTPRVDGKRSDENRALRPRALPQIIQWRFGIKTSVAYIHCMENRGMKLERLFSVITTKILCEN
jgi:hypothetical protein